MDKQNNQESPLIAHARHEMEFLGLFDEDSDYGGMIAKTVMELMELFASQGHSGYSAGLVASLWYTLAQWKTLYPITNEPSEWNEVTDAMYTKEQIANGDRIWQSKRSPSIFSKDGGKTWEDMNNKINGVSMTREEALNAVGKEEEGLQKGSGEDEGSSKTHNVGGVSTKPSAEQIGTPEKREEKSSGNVEGSQQKLENHEQANGNKPPQGSPKTGAPSKKSKKKSRKEGKAGGKS